MHLLTAAVLAAVVAAGWCDAQGPGSRPHPRPQRFRPSTSTSSSSDDHGNSFLTTDSDKNSFTGSSSDGILGRPGVNDGGVILGFPPGSGGFRPRPGQSFGTPSPSSFGTPAPNTFGSPGNVVLLAPSGGFPGQGSFGNPNSFSGQGGFSNPNSFSGQGSFGNPNIFPGQGTFGNAGTFPNQGVFGGTGTFPSQGVFRNPSSTLPGQGVFVTPSFAGQQGGFGTPLSFGNALPRQDRNTFNTGLKSSGVFLGDGTSGTRGSSGGFPSNTQFGSLGGFGGAIPVFVDQRTGQVFLAQGGFPGFVQNPFGFSQIPSGGFSQFGPGQTGSFGFNQFPVNANVPTVLPPVSPTGSVFVSPSDDRVRPGFDSSSGTISSAGTLTPRFPPPNPSRRTIFAAGKSGTAASVPTSSFSSKNDTN